MSRITPPAASGYDMLGYYFQATYSLNHQWLIGARHDHFENNNPAPAPEELPMKKITGTVFINYRFNENAVAKIEHHEVNEDVNYRKTIFSIALNLGN